MIKYRRVDLVLTPDTSVGKPSEEMNLVNILTLADRRNISLLLYSLNKRSLVAQWVKHWPTDLAIPGSIPT